MLKKSLVVFCIVVGLIAFFYSTQTPAYAASAQEVKSIDFSKVYPFATSGGFIGFFDQSTGIVYIYDENLENCVMISQMEKLGESMNKLKLKSRDNQVTKYSY